MLSRRHLIPAITVTVCLSVGCGGDTPMPVPPTGPNPSVTANAYILPGAVSLADQAFGDEPIVIHPNERLRWINVDRLAHRIVADSPHVTNFAETRELRPGEEESVTMTRVGTTRIHCAIHPSMTGTLIVREH
jgi:plastocyanin